MKSLIAVLTLAATLAGVHAAPAAAATKHAQRFDIIVTSRGFEPASLHVKAGQPVRLVVTRKTERTCATRIVVHGYGIDRALPLNQSVEVRFTPRKAGAIRYACAMDMIAGSLVVE
jgi:plastocyanin domain-containing protein